MKAIKVLVLRNRNDSSISQIIDILKNNDLDIDICNNNNEFLERIYNNLYDLYLIISIFLAKTYIFFDREPL